MAILNEERQLVAVKKVLEEMEKAFEYVKTWNASWLEQLLDAHFLNIHHKIGESDVMEMESRYNSRYKLSNALYSDDNIGIPLAKEILFGNNALTGKKYQKFEVEFGRIDWYDMDSHKSSRYFSFNNNGLIKFSKSAKFGKRRTPRQTKQISYDTSFNVLSNNFDISITIDQLINNNINNHAYDYFILSLKGDTVVEKFNDIEITKNFSTGMRIVKIDKRNKQNNISVIFEAALNSDDNLEFGTVTIENHKGNGKVNGTYKFDNSKKYGIRANFYSRKGVKVDLTESPALLKNANTLLSTQSSNNSCDMLISDFTNSIQLSIAKKLSKKVSDFDNSDFNIKLVKQVENQVEKRVLEIIKCIRGELPLFGLIDRIDNCLEIIDKNQNSKISESANYKVLKLKIPKNNQ